MRESGTTARGLRFFFKGHPPQADGKLARKSFFFFSYIFFLLHRILAAVSTPSFHRAIREPQGTRHLLLLGGTSCRKSSLITSPPPASLLCLLFCLFALQASGGHMVDLRGAVGGLPVRSEKCVYSGEIDIYLFREMRGSQRTGIGPHASSEPPAGPDGSKAWVRGPLLPTDHFGG